MRLLAGFSDSAVTVLGLYYKMQTFFFIPLMGLQDGYRSGAQL